jgi:hypothetical protein
VLLRVCSCRRRGWNQRLCYKVPSSPTFNQPASLTTSLPTHSFSTSICICIHIHRGGLLDIKLVVTGPDNDEIFSSILFSNRDDAGNVVDDLLSKGVTFTAGKKGVYTFCLGKLSAPCLI